MSTDSKQDINLQKCFLDTYYATMSDRSIPEIRLKSCSQVERLFKTVTLAVEHYHPEYHCVCLKRVCTIFYIGETKVKVCRKCMNAFNFDLKMSEILQGIQYLVAEKDKTDIISTLEEVEKDKSPV